MGSRSGRPSTDETITVFHSDGKVVARDEETGVSSFGETKYEALANLSEALELYEEPVPVEDDAEEESDAPWM